MSEASYLIDVNLETKTYNNKLDKLLAESRKRIVKFAGELEKSLNQPMKNAIRNHEQVLSRMGLTQTKFLNKHKRDFDRMGSQTRDTYNRIKDIHTNSIRTQMKNITELKNKNKEYIDQSTKGFQKMANMHNKVYKNDKKRKSSYSVTDRIATGALYSVGHRLLSEIINETREVFEKDKFLRLAVFESTNDKNKPTLRGYETFANTVGGKTMFTNTQVAEALHVGAKLGLGQDLKPVVESATELAQALGDTDLNKTLEQSVTMFKALGIEMNKVNMSRFQDNLLTVANNTKADVEALYNGIAYSGAMIKGTGTDNSQAIAILGMLNDFGLDSSKAGTALNSFLQSGTNFNKRSKIQALTGRDVMDKNGNFDAIGVLKGFSEALKGVNKVEASGLIQDIFNVRGGRAANLLIDPKNIDKITNLMEMMNNDHGRAKNQSEGMMSGIFGSSKKAFSKLSTMFQKIVSTITPILTVLLNALGAIANSIGLIFDLLGGLSPVIVTVFSLPLLKAFLGKLLGIGGGLKYLKSVGLSLGMIFKMMFSWWGVGLLLLSPLIYKAFELLSAYQELISNNTELSESWSEMATAFKTLFATIGGLMLDVITTMLGIGITQKDLSSDTESLKNKFESIKETIISINQKITALREWIKEHRTIINTISKIILAITFVVKILQFISYVTNGIIWAFQVLSGLIPPIATGVTTIATGLGVSAGLVAGAIVAGIAIVVGAVYLIVKHWETIKYYCFEVWEWLKKLGSTILETGKMMFEALVSPFKTVYDFIQKSINAWNNWKGKDISVEQKQHMEYMGIDMLPQHAVGTNNFRSGRFGGYTTINEQGDEAIWLPNGSMIATNTTTRDMLAELRNLNKQGNGYTTVKNINGVNIYVYESDNPKQTANEIIAELETIYYM